jgi:7-carboxy-7-deazaguanine synthase
MNLKISEIFYSIQGEGKLAGVPSAFIRLAGCDLRCLWCDTTYALHAHQGKDLAIEAVLQQIALYDTPYVVVTGGEPLISPQLPQLLHALKQQNKHITLETSATQYRPVTADLISISPKLAHSIPHTGPHADFAPIHKTRRLNIEAIQYFIGHHEYQLKFVVGDQNDLAEVDQILAELQNVSKDRIMLMPQARTKQQYRAVSPQVAKMCIEKGFRFCPRLHLELWGCRGGK